MKEPTWTLNEIVIAVHQILLSEHGGSPGRRDTELLGSALAKPKQRLHYEASSTIFQLAASYSFGIAKNHPFIDGNKRVALTIGAIFLELNGYILDAPEPDAALIFESLAAGNISEEELAQWFEAFSKHA